MKCKTKYCRGIATKTGRSPYCAKCRTRHWRDKHPAAYFLLKLKHRAKRRGKEFSLTLEQFKTFCDESMYLQLKGRSALSLSIHRSDNERGYHFDNITAITVSANSRLSRVPYFKDKEAERQAIEEAEWAVHEAYFKDK